MDDSAVAVSIMQASLVVLPLWLATLRYVKSDIEWTRDDVTTTQRDEHFTILIHPLLVGISFFSIFGAFTTSTSIALGNNIGISKPINFLTIFFLCMGIQTTSTFVSGISEAGYGKTGERVAFAGLIVGLIFVIYISGVL
ncbi:hypothetical protein [Haladaptatus sp. CMSO5]|uniref:hypothetical protein n=1 Tax=Haladaptatus sp. CMSO5 TaxID=3120514 RepID=UPI002FCE0679